MILLLVKVCLRVWEEFKTSVMRGIEGIIGIDKHKHPHKQLQQFHKPVYASSRDHPVNC